MDPIIKYSLNSIKQFTLSLKKKSLLIDKPWILIDNDGAIQKFIFKKDKGLVLSKNGKVTEGSWEYFAEARSLLIDRQTDKLLLNEEFVDENVLLLKKDGTENEFYALANENVIPDYNIPKYLNSIRCKKLNLVSFELFNGATLQICDASNPYYVSYDIGKNVEMLNSKYEIINVNDGPYISLDKKITFNLKDGKLESVRKNLLINSKDGLTYEVEEGADFSVNLNKRITLNGNPVINKRIVCNDIVLYTGESKVLKIRYIGIYGLSGGYKVTIEHQKDNRFSKGDKIILTEPTNPLPDGRYKVNGTFWKTIKVVNSIIQ